VDFLFGPLEGGGVLIPASDKGFDRLDQHFNAGKAGSLQCAAAQNAKPAFHLIEPGAVCRDEMKMDLGMGFEPAILLGFMRIEIVQHNVNLFVRIFGYQLVHEIQKFASAPAPIMPCMHQPSGHLQGRKERGGAMALVFVCKASEGSTVGQANPALRPLQRLNAGLLIHTEHQRVLGRVQIEPNHISRFAAELRIGAYTPALPASQTQMVLSHDPPDLILAHLAQMLGKQSPVPAAVASRRRLIERLQDPLSAEDIWRTYVLLSRVEAPFRTMKSPLYERPIFHHLEQRVETHIFLCVLAYHLLVCIERAFLDEGIHTSWETLRTQLSTHQVVTVRLPTTDGRAFTIRRDTRPEQIHRDIYRVLHIPERILSPIKRWEPK